MCSLLFSNIQEFQMTAQLFKNVIHRLVESRNYILLVSAEFLTLTWKPIRDIKCSYLYWVYVVKVCRELQRWPLCADLSRWPVSDQSQLWMAPKGTHCWTELSQGQTLVWPMRADLRKGKTPAAQQSTVRLFSIAVWQSLAPCTSRQTLSHLTWSISCWLTRFRPLLKSKLGSEPKESSDRKQEVKIMLATQQHIFSTSL